MARKKAYLPRQRLAVLVGIANGKTNREIADAMSITLDTVKTHVVLLYKDLGITGESTGQRRGHAVGVGLRYGLLRPHQIVFEGECPGTEVVPNYCRCSCPGCRSGRCEQHVPQQIAEPDEPVREAPVRREDLLGERPSERCRNGVHTRCTERDCTCQCRHRIRKEYR